MLERMVFYAGFFGLLAVLFLVSQEMTKSISFVMYRMTHSQKISMYALAVLFFPGVVVHELSHFLSALLLGVHAENPEFFPKMIDGRLKLGSVSIQKTDPIRKTLIGVAPVLGGVGMLLLGVFLYREYMSESALAFVILAVVYFQIANSMFSSRKDMEGTGIFFLILIGLGIALWMLQVPVLSFFLTSEIGLLIQSLLERGSLYLGIAVFIDIVLLTLLWIIAKLLLR